MPRFQGKDRRLDPADEGFFARTGVLARVFVLIDGRHGIKDPIAKCSGALNTALSYQIVLTKRDELKKDQVEKTVAETKDVLRGHSAAHPDALFFSCHRTRAKVWPTCAPRSRGFYTRRDRTIFGRRKSAKQRRKFLRRFLQRDGHS